MSNSETPLVNGAPSRSRRSSSLNSRLEAPAGLQITLLEELGAEGG